MHRTRWTLVGAVGLGLGVVGLASGGREVPSTERAPAATAPPRVRDRRTLAFREDAEPARVVAELEARVESRVGADGDATVCVVHASATGPRVHGAPGPLGVHGGNRITAEELSMLLARDGVALRPRGGTTRGPSASGPRVTRGPVLERRLREDGTVVHEPAGPADGAVAATWTSPPLPDGTSTLEVVADGRVRVRCVVRVGDGDGRVLRLVQVDEHGHEVGS